MSNPLKHLKTSHISGALGALAALASFISLTPHDWKKLVIVAWLTIPPVFFFLEIHRVRRENPADLADCKMSQEAAAKIWAGVAAALVVLYLR
ncbi:MAG TPA: hypothetical protein VFE33_14335 [Thermoanaerobaculia bacterium]|nr:hypothetical protein [Thermoanaerobaculia bacterium]